VQNCTSARPKRARRFSNAECSLNAVIVQVVSDERLPEISRQVVALALESRLHRREASKDSLLIAILMQKVAQLQITL
jgi:hypothetical protein